MARELFDDEIESLQLFDPLTGRRCGRRSALHRSSQQPLRHAAARVARRKPSRAGCSASAGLSRQGKLVEAQRLEQMPFDLEMIGEVGHCKGHRELLPPPGGAAGQPPATLTDYCRTTSSCSWMRAT